MPSPSSWAIGHHFRQQLAKNSKLHALGGGFSKPPSARCSLLSVAATTRLTCKICWQNGACAFARDRLMSHGIGTIVSHSKRDCNLLC